MMGRRVVYFQRNKEARRGHWFAEEDDTGGFRHVGSNTFSSKKVRHKAWNLEDRAGWKYRLGNARMC